MGNLVWNERAKLFANALDRASTASLTVGVIAPIAGALYNVGALGASWLQGSLYGVVWLFAALVLHLSARLVLGRLKE